MLDSRERGYAVMSPDFNGIGFTSSNFEDCKRYCFNGDVIVEVTPKKCGFNIRFRYNKRFPLFEFRKYAPKIFFKCQFIFDWEYTHKYGTKVLYTNPLSYSESLEKGK